ncbi:MAG: MmgE/PrpD family protein [Chloroflexi bacterium]|nr:MmgE/PrpD family protein [Chloroflexota bacterium]
MTSSMPVSRLLAEFAAGARYDDLPPHVVGETQRAILDWLGSALAGALEPPARIVQQVIASFGAADEATVFGAGRAAAASAALANGVASHILELDDVHKGSTLHAAAPIIPAALAVAEREHADGASFLLAVALGYDAALRVGEAVNPTHYRFWHPTGTAATFGAAVAAGSLLKLNGAQMLDALGSAGTQASGLWEFNADGAMSKHLHPGKAAFNGVLAADLARRGFSGATRILEGERGFFRATSEQFDASRITDGLGQRWKIGENCYKLYSCCGHTHSAIDAALDFRQQQQWQGDEALAGLAGVQVETYAPGYEIVKEMNPATPYQAKFSLAYCVAAGLLEGWVGLEQFTLDRFEANGVRNEKIAALLKRLRVTVAPDVTANYPAEWGTRITFTLSDGRAQTMSAAFPRGNPENPVSTAVLEDKFRALVAPCYSRELAEAAINAVRQLERCGDMAQAVADLA